MTPTETVEAFIAHLNAMELEAAFALLAEDVVYHNIPMSPVTGRAGVKAVFDQIPMTEMDWETHAIAASGPVVLTERTDRFTLSDGRKLAIQVMGTFEVADGRISAWRDYFDLGQWMQQMAPSAG